MDIMYTAMGIILLKTQPLLVFLELGSSAIAVQIAALAAITLISIAVTIGIVALMDYGLKKLINPEKIPLANEFVAKKVKKKLVVENKKNDSEIVELHYSQYTPKYVQKKPKANTGTPKKVVWMLPPKNKNPNEEENEVEIIDTPEIVTARQNLEMAKKNHTQVLAYETECRQKLEASPFLSHKAADPDKLFFSYARQDEAQDKMDRAQEALEKLIFTQKIKP